MIFVVIASDVAEVVVIVLLFFPKIFEELYFKFRLSVNQSIFDVAPSSSVNSSTLAYERGVGETFTTAGPMNPPSSYQ